MINLNNTELLEAQILGTIFLDPSLTSELVGSIHKDMFHQVRHRELFGMICWLFRNRHEVTHINVATYFPDDLEKVGGIGYISEMTSSIASINQIQHTLKLFFEMNARGKLVQLMNEYLLKATDPKSGAFDELLDEFEQKALDIRPKHDKEQCSVDALVAWHDELIHKMEDPKRAFGMMTGYDELDRLTLGFQRADFFVLGARTSMGKSGFAIETALRLSKHGNKVALFSLEMNKPQIFNRMSSNLSGISMQALRVGNVTEGHLHKIADAMEFMHIIHIDDTRGITAEYITSEMRRIKRQQGLDFVIIDYLQEIKEASERNDNTGSALHRVCQKLRAAAKECDCHILGLSQVKREVEIRQNKRPMTSDLSGSSAIEAVADGIMLLYRDEYYNPDTPDKGILELHLAKQRNGPTGMIKLKYEKDSQRITNKEGSGYFG